MSQVSCQTPPGERGAGGEWRAQQVAPLPARATTNPCPAFYVRYTTVMRYKAMAKKLRQVVGLADPVPAEAVLVEPPCDEGEGKGDYGTYEVLDREGGRPVDGLGRLDTSKGMHTEMPNRKVMRAEVPDLAVVRARAVWLEVVDGVRGSPTALMERLDSLTDPERVDEANMLAGWRAKYENEITARRKSLWWRRMARKRDVG